MEHKNQNIANLDEYQMYNRVFDPSKDAFRMSIVDGVTLNVDNIQFPEQKQAVIQQTEIKVIEVPVIVKELEIKEVQTQVIVKEPEIITIEKPVYITEVKIIEIEKPVIVKETELKVVEIVREVSTMPMIAKVCMVIQAAALIGLLLTRAI